MAVADWATTISGGLSVLAAVGFTIRWTIKHYLSELKPDGNGGHNLEGRVRRVEQRTEDIYNLLIELINKK
jgi:hypothetical protein